MNHTLALPLNLPIRARLRSMSAKRRPTVGDVIASRCCAASPTLKDTRLCPSFPGRACASALASWRQGSGDALYQIGSVHAQPSCASVDKTFVHRHLLCQPARLTARSSFAAFALDQPSPDGTVVQIALAKLVVSPPATLMITVRGRRSETVAGSSFNPRFSTCSTSNAPNFLVISSWNIRNGFCKTITSGFIVNARARPIKLTSVGVNAFILGRAAGGELGARMDF